MSDILDYMILGLKGFIASVITGLLLVAVSFIVGFGLNSMGEANITLTLVSGLIYVPLHLTVWGYVFKEWLM